MGKFQVEILVVYSFETEADDCEKAEIRVFDNWECLDGDIEVCEVQASRPVSEGLNDE